MSQLITKESEFQEFADGVAALATHGTFEGKASIAIIANANGKAVVGTSSDGRTRMCAFKANMKNQTAVGSLTVTESPEASYKDKLDNTQALYDMGLTQSIIGLLEGITPQGVSARLIHSND